MIEKTLELLQKAVLVTISACTEGKVELQVMKKKSLLDVKVIGNMSSHYVCKRLEQTLKDLEEQGLFDYLATHTKPFSIIGKRNRGEEATVTIVSTEEAEEMLQQVFK